MKKILSVLLCLSLLFSLTSCGKLPEWPKADRYYIGSGWSLASPDGVKYVTYAGFDIFDGIRVTKGKALGTYKDDCTVRALDDNSGAVLLDWGLVVDEEYEKMHHNLAIMVPEGEEFYDYRNCDIGGIAFIPWMEERETDEWYDFAKYIRKHGITGDEANAIHKEIYSSEFIYGYNDYFPTELAGFLVFYPEGVDSFCFLVEVTDTLDNGFVACSLDVWFSSDYPNNYNNRQQYLHSANAIPDDIVEKLGITTDIWG